MNKDSSGFTFLFATIMVVVVGLVLSLAAIFLGPFQARNMRLEKMQNILASINVASSAKDAEKLYSQYIIEEAVINKKGEKVESAVTAFDVDLKKEMDKEKTGNGDKQLFPLFVFAKDQQTFYVIPVRGRGLWGPIWGYIAMRGDGNTIHGASFGHKGETPGLGAEIDTKEFQQQFNEKTILDESGKFVSVKVLKGGASPGDLHGVDAVSGGTITSNGVTEMLERTLKVYVPYMKSISKKE